MQSVDLYSCLLLQFFLVRVFPLRQSCEMVSHFVLLHQNNANSSPGLLSFAHFSGFYAVLIDAFSKYRIRLTNLVNASWLKN